MLTINQIPWYKNATQNAKISTYTEPCIGKKIKGTWPNNLVISKCSSKTALRRHSMSCLKDTQIWINHQKVLRDLVLFSFPFHLTCSPSSDQSVQLLVCFHQIKPWIWRSLISAPTFYTLFNRKLHFHICHKSCLTHWRGFQKRIKKVSFLHCWLTTSSSLRKWRMCLLSAEKS